LKRLAHSLLFLLCFFRAAAVFSDGGKEFDLETMSQWEGRTVSSVEIDADIGVEDPKAFLGIDDSTTVSQAFIHQVIEKIWNTGRVAVVSVFAAADGTGGVGLKIHATLRMHLHSISFEGNKNIKSGELSDVAGYRPDMEIFNDTMDRIENLILERYTLRGYPYAAVTLTEKPLDEADKIKLVVKINEGKPIKMWKVSFTGRPIFSPLKLKKLTKIKGGDVYDQVRIEEGLEKLKKELRKIGFFNCAVNPLKLSLDKKSRLKVEIEVDPGPNYEIVFLGNEHLDRDRILEVMEFEKQPEIGPAVVEEMADRLVEHYRKLGFTMVSVSGDMYEKDGGKRGVILFSVKEGQRVEVKGIKFVGNVRFSSNYLHKEVESVLNQYIDYKVLFVTPSFESIDSLGFSGKSKKPSHPAKKSPTPLQQWKPKKIFLKESYDKAAEHVQELYFSEGYLEAEVREPAIEIDAKGESMTVTFVIDEGVRTWVESVKFKGVKNADMQDILKVTGIAPKKPFNGMAIKESENAIMDYYYDLGYRFATVEYDLKFSEDGTEAYLTYTVDEGPLVSVEGITIRGNVSTKKSLILDRITLKPGDVFTKKKQEKSSGYLRELGIFNSVVTSMEEPGIISNKKRALIQISEKKSQFLELRAGASSGEGLRGGMEYGYQNLFGYALDFGFLVSFNYRFFFVGTGRYFPSWYQDELSLLDQLERNIAVRIGIPHLPKVGRWLTLQTSFGHLRKNSNLYGLTKNSVYQSFLFNPIPAIHFSVRAGFEDSGVGTNTVAERAINRQIQTLPLCTPEITKECLSTEDFRALRVPVGKTAFTVLGTDFTLDLRDSAFNPTSGLRTSLGLSWVRSTKHALQVHRLYADNESYKTWKTFAFSNLLKNTLSIAGYIPLGTPKVILMLYGAAGYIIQLQDRSETFADRLFYLGGGHTMRGFPEESLCNVESPPGICAYGGNLMVNYKIELMFPIYKELRGAVFSDIGNLWKDPENFSIIDLRATVGLGIRYVTPIGPLNLDYGIIVNRDESRGDPFGAIHFSIGTF
jgi:outer membrane protein insertion porin family